MHNAHHTFTVRRSDRKHPQMHADTSANAQAVSLTGDRSTRPTACDQSETSVSTRAQCSSDQMRLLTHAAGYHDRRNRRPLRGRASQAVSPPVHQPTSARQTSRAAWLFRSSASFCTLTDDEVSGRSQTRTLLQAQYKIYTRKIVGSVRCV